MGCKSVNTSDASQARELQAKKSQARSLDQSDAKGLIGQIENYSYMEDATTLELYRTFDFDINEIKKVINTQQTTLDNLTLEVERLTSENEAINKRLDSITDNPTDPIEPTPNPRYAAFPTAFGSAYDITGGRGRTLYKVTNLNNSGSGSFRDAVSQSNRNVVFDVSGTIELTSSLSITSSNLSIFGQTAPKGGITITGKEVHYNNNSNIIVRYVRFRPDYNASGNIDAVNAYNCSDFIMDHCSVSYGGDEAFSLRGASSNVTIQNSIFAESATGMIAGESSNTASDSFSIIGNLWYNISHRFPNIVVDRTDVINNVVYNHYSRTMVVANRNGAKLNEIGNYYRSGNTTSEYPYNVNWLDIGSSSQRSAIRVFTDGNVFPGVLSEGQDNWKLYVHRFNVTGGAYAGTKQWDAANRDFQVSEPFAFLGQIPEIKSAQDAFDSVRSNAGANKYIDDNGYAQTEWDAVDSLYLQHVNNGTSEAYVYPPTAITSKQSYRDFHDSVSSTPISTRPNGYDTDSDGICDAWETRNYGTLSYSFNDIPNGKEYSIGEEFVNSVDN